MVSIKRILNMKKIIYLVYFIPIIVFSQNNIDSNKKNQYKTGIALNLGIGNSTISVDDVAFSGNSSTVSLQGDFVFKNGITLSPSIGLITTKYLAFNGAINSSNEITMLRSPLKLGYGFSINKENKIRLLPRVGFYYSNYLKHNTQDNLRQDISEKNIGGNFGFVADIALSFEISPTIYAEVFFSRSNDFDDVTLSSNQKLKIEDDKAINISISYWF